MTSLLFALQILAAVYTMNNVQLTAAVLAAVITVILIVRRRSRRQRLEGARNR